MRQAGLGKSEALSPFLLILVVPLPAHGQPVCMPRAEIVARLEHRYQEHQIAAGLTLNDWLIEVWATEDGETWTLLLTQPNGMSCVIGAGTYWLFTGKPDDGT